MRWPIRGHWLLLCLLVLAAGAADNSTAIVDNSTAIADSHQDELASVSPAAGLRRPGEEGVAMKASIWEAWLHSIRHLPNSIEAYLWWPLILYMFYVMSVVCDDFLMPAVDSICERFKIPDDVAGATLVAFACNGPELLTNSASIYLKTANVGMGTIVGSAIFNVLVIVGCCPLSAPDRWLKVNPVCFLRDSIFSALSIVILWWALPVIDLFRASVLVALSVVYIVVVAKTESWFGLSNDEMYGGAHVLNKGLLQASVISPGGSASAVFATHTEPFLKAERPIDEEQVSTTASADRPDNQEPPTRHQGVLAWLMGIVLAPGNAALRATIPDVRRKESKQRYVSGFFLSMAWLSGTAYIVCLGADRIHLFWGLSESFLGLTLCAVGTSWPNMLASVITARAGRGAISVSNALGSNVQNVFFVLAFPIWVSILFRGDYVMQGSDILESVVWMGATLALVIVSVVLSSFKVRSEAGVVFIAVYLVYVVQATIHTA